MLTWLSVWSEVQRFTYGPADATATSSSLTSLKSRIGLTFLVPAYPGCPGKEAVKQVSVCFIVAVLAIYWVTDCMCAAWRLFQEVEESRAEGLYLDSILDMMMKSQLNFCRVNQCWWWLVMFICVIENLLIRLCIIKHFDLYIYQLRDS